jgi:hypothetical protein
MHDHDQRFKALIQEFFGDFLRLFFADWADRFDCDKVEWLDKEVFPDPPEGSRHVLDLVARMPTREGVPGQAPGEPENWLALVHVEIESPDKLTPFRGRMFYYHVHLRAKHRLPVLPIGLFLKVGLEGIGEDTYEERFWSLQTVQFRYLYVGLPGLDGVKYLESDNWLGVALSALMKIPKDKLAWLGAEALRKIKDAPLTDQKRFLLAECVQAYLPLDAERQREFEAITATEKYQGVRQMNLTWYDKGVLKGREQERRTMLLELLEEKFSPLPAAVRERIEHLTWEQLGPLNKAVLRAQSLQELGLEP